MSGAACGTVYLVGAGTGEIGLVTLRALRLIRRADVLVYDRLIDDALPALAPPSCERVYAGKRAGDHALPQPEINRLLADRARRGDTVVRLKGGDPYVFGRGGEEALYLRACGVPFETVPGVTSAVAGLCCAGIPVTHRGMASSFHVVAGNNESCRPEDIDWGALASLRGTLVFLMGLQNLPLIASSLAAHGMDPATPAAVVSHAACHDQKVVAAPLGELAAAVEADPVAAPALIAVGQVVSLRERLNFFEDRKHRPLFGKTVVLTRPDDGEELRDLLLDAGARVARLPLIAFSPLELPPGWSDALGTYTDIVFTSRHAVERFFSCLMAAGGDARRLAGASVWAVGPATAASLRARGVAPDGVPERRCGDGLWEALRPRLAAQSRVLLPRAREAAGELDRRVREICPADALPLYETLPLPENAARAASLLAEEAGGCAVLASPSAARALFACADARAAERARFAAIGPATAAELADRGVRCAVAAEPSARGMLEAVLKSFEEEA